MSVLDFVYHKKHFYKITCGRSEEMLRDVPWLKNVRGEFCVVGYRKPTVDEAELFLGNRMYDLLYDRVCSVEEISKKEAIQEFGMEDWRYQRAFGFESAHPLRASLMERLENAETQSAASVVIHTKNKEQNLDFLELERVFMQYKGFEVYASEIPEGLVPEERLPVGGGKVFACEVYAAEDEGQENVLTVFDLAVGRDIVDDSEKTIIAALKRYVDDHYGELLAQAVPAQGQGGRAKGQGKVAQNSDSAMVQTFLNQIDSERVTETANAVLCFDHENGQKVVCVDFCYDTCEGLPECDVVNLLTLPATEENVELAQAVLQGVVEGWKVPGFDSVSQEVANDPKTKVFQVFEELVKLQQTEAYQVAAVMAYLDEHCEPVIPLTDDELYSLSVKLEQAMGEWFDQGLLREEYLDALISILENGLDENYGPRFPSLDVIEARELLLAGNNQVFGTVVEATAMYNSMNRDFLGRGVEQDDVDAVLKAADAVRGLVGDVGELIGAANDRSVGDAGVPKNKDDMILD